MMIVVIPIPRYLSSLIPVFQIPRCPDTLMFSSQRVIKPAYLVSQTFRYSHACKYKMSIRFGPSPADLTTLTSSSTINTNRMYVYADVVENPTVNTSLRGGATKNCNTISKSNDLNVLGFPNLGTTCFINVTFQLLLRSKKFVNICFNTESINHDILSDTSKTVKLLFNKRIPDITNFIQTMSTHSELNQFSTGMHDIFEFYTKFCDSITMDISARDLNANAFSDFCGNFRINLSDDDGSTIYDKIQNFSNIVLPLPEGRVTRHTRYNLIELINSFLSPQPTESNSNKYGPLLTLSDSKYTPRLKTTYFHKLPNKLVIQISRSCYQTSSSGDFSAYKQTTPVIIPTVCDLVSDNGLVTYDLDMIILHSGSTNAGHYYAIVRSTSGWSIINDCSVSDLSTESLNNFLNNSCEPYGIIYNIRNTNSVSCYNSNFQVARVSRKLINNPCGPRNLKYGEVRLLKRKFIDNINTSQYVVNVTPNTMSLKPVPSTTILFSNVRGLKNREKINSLKYESKNDTILCLNETNYTESDKIKLIYDNIGVDASIVSSNNIKYNKHGQPYYIDNCKNFKNNGFGTALITKDIQLTKFLEKSTKFEIILAEFRIGHVKGLVVTAYRSPSMRHIDSNKDFFDEIGEFIAKHDGVKNHFIIYMCDDNINPKDEESKIGKLRNAIFIRFRMVNLILGQPTRLNGQPDSCFAFFDPAMLSVRALVIGKIHHSMDHSAIRITIDFKGTIPRLPCYNKPVTRKVRKLSDEKIDALIVELMRPWTKRYTQILSECLSQFDPNIITHEIVDSAATSFLDVIDDVKSRAWSTVVSTLESKVSERLNSGEVKIASEDAKLSKLAYDMKTRPDDLSLRKLFLRIQQNRSKLIRVEAAEKLKNDISKQSNKSYTSSKEFYKIAGKLLSNESPDTPSTIDSNNTRNKKRLENDKTYFNQNIDTELIVEDIVPFTKFDFNVGVDDIARIIKEMNNIDKFYKIHSKHLQYPILVMLTLIEHTDYFPKVMRHSKLSQLPKRHIYSLDTFPKICEKVIHEALEVCLANYYTANEDPMQMAYEKNRGCESCNAISLANIEKSLMYDKQSCTQVYIDLKKAFNRANRQTIINESQRIAGAGQIMKSWFSDRTYSFDNNIFELKANCGVLPGTLFGVFGFKVFINTDVDLTNNNKDLLWASPYSDDRSPIANANTVNSGKFQNYLNKSVSYMKSQGCQYHLDGTKAPHLLYFQKSSLDQIINVTGLKIENTLIKHVDRTKILGLNIATKSDRVGSSKLIKNYSYVLEPPIFRYVTLCNRIQHMQGQFPPELLKQAVSSYFCGLFRYSAALYWLRATDEDLKTIRFYYTLCLSAVLGLTGYETVGAVSMMNNSVLFSNSFYRKMLIITGMPSLKDMAIDSARTIIDQTFHLKHEYFAISSYRCEKHSLLDSNGYPKTIAPSMKNTILDHILQLAKTKTYRETEKKWKSKAIYQDLYLTAQSQFCTEIPPVTSKANTTLFLSKSAKKKLRRKKKKRFDKIPKEVDPLYITTLYKNLVRDEFGLLDTNERRLIYRSPTSKLIVNRICTIRPPDFCDKRSIKHPRLAFSCLTTFRHNSGNVCLSDLITCLICNNCVHPNLSNQSISCKKCFRTFHKTCVDTQNFRVSSSFKCSDISKLLDNNIVTSGRSYAKLKIRDKCLVCGLSCDNPNKISCSND